MTFKALFNQFTKFFKSNPYYHKTSVIKKNLNFIYYLTFLIIFFIVYTAVSNKINNSNKLVAQNINKTVNSDEFYLLKNFLISNLRSPYKEYKYIIENNDSIEKILNKFNIKNSEVSFITKKLKERKLTNIYAGRELTIIVKNELKSKKNILVNIFYPISNTLSIEIRKNQEKFEIKENILQLYKKEIVVKNSIKNNLYKAAIDKKIEPNIIIEFARIYGFEIDFQRDIRKNDEFEIYYERFVDDNNVVRDTGKILYASMKVNNREITLYNFKYNNQSGYYDINGKSIVKSLMKTPINGARLSSSFGMRKHPILGFNKMHKGTDFAAASGTPIMASGSGTIIRSRWCGGGGNCIKIKHNSTYETIYAHMKSFAKGIKEGRKVKQGQIIGYVGSTGMSTGPHLHYEVVVNGKKVNSQKLNLPSGKILKGDERKDFEIHRIKTDLKISELRDY
jgi:murein DD-endopeptidase MepM/ murein hydrolase activator NlpD